MEPTRKRIIVVGTLDTKGAEVLYLKKELEALGTRVAVIDTGVLGEPYFRPTISREEVAQAAGMSLEDVVRLGHEGKAIAKMAKGAAVIAARLHTSGNLHAIVGLGASMGTSLALTVMKALPIGVPKLIVSTIAYSPLIRPDHVCADLMMMQWTGGFWGLNSLSKDVLRKAAQAIVGAAKAYETDHEDERPIRIGVTSMGIRACRYMNYLQPILENKGYELVAFHTDGIGGRVFEQAVSEGLIDAALDLAAFELGNQVCGGLCSAGAHRYEAAAEKGIPQVVAPGGIDTFAIPTDRGIPDALRGRFKHLHNSLMMVIGSIESEREEVGRRMAIKLNRSRGPTAVVIPTGGFSSEDRAGGLWHCPGGPAAFARGLKGSIAPNIEVVELDCHINEPLFAETTASLLIDMINRGSLKRRSG